MANNAVSIMLTGRLYWPKVFDPAPVSEKEPDVLKYQTKILWDKVKDKEQIDAFKAARSQAIKNGIADPKVWNGVKPDTKSRDWEEVLRDGDEKPKPGKTADPNLKGCYYINLKSNADNPPEIVDRDPNKSITDKSRIYSGVICNVSGRVFPWANKGNAGVSCGLGNIQFVADAPRLDGRKRAADEFKPLAGVQDDDFDTDLDDLDGDDNLDDLDDL